MTTFLNLCKDLRRELDIAGTGPSSVSNQTGELGNLVEWINQAYIDIQNRRNGNWRWLRRPYTIQTTADDDEYAAGEFTDVLASALIDRFSRWRMVDSEDPPMVFLTSAGVGTQRWTVWTQWDWFKHLYRIGTQNSGAPVFVSSDPQDNLVLGPAPNAIYTITGDYWRSPQVLSDGSPADDEVPEMPVQFHKLIVWEAMIHYGFQQAAPEVLGHAKEYKMKMMRQLESNQFPKFKVGIPMA